MTQETKDRIITGGFIVLAVVVAIVLWKRYQANVSSSSGADAQNQADELQYLEASALANSYAGYAGGSATVTAAPPPSVTSLASEIAGIEAAFGLTPPAATPAPGTTTTTTPATTPTTTPTQTGGTGTAAAAISQPPVLLGGAEPWTENPVNVA
jgi:hypothetical protein